MNKEFEEYILAQQPFPLLGADYRQGEFAPVDLSTDNASATTFGLHTFSGLQEYVHLQHRKTRALVLYGGYLERRRLYQESSHFSESEKPRNIHLGLDLWRGAGTPVYAPLSGTIHSFQYNDKPLDYGATIIVRHQYPEWIFHTLYGHLSLSSIVNLKVGQAIEKGEKLAEFGSPEENGGWVPHLHFQLIFDMQDRTGDYPGVCSEDQLDVFRNNCPDPSVFLSAYSVF